MFPTNFTDFLPSYYGIVQYVYMLYAILVVPFVFYCFVKYFGSQDHAIRLFVLIIMYFGLQGFLYYFGFAPRDLVLATITSTYAPFMFLTGYYFTKSNDYGIKTAVACTLLLFALGSIINFFVFANSYFWANVVYLMIPLFPIIMLSKSNILILCTFLIAITFSIITGKRSGFIALGGCFALYLIIENIVKKKHVALTLLATITMIIISAIVTVKINKLFDNSIEERYIQAIETGGSGRLDIWKNKLDQFMNLPTTGMIFGEGFFANEMSRPHNDFLDIAISYGLIGLLMYVSMWLALLYKAVALISIRSSMASSFTAAIWMLFSFSFVSIVWHMPTIFAYIFIFFGMAYALSEKERLTNSLQRPPMFIPLNTMF